MTAISLHDCAAKEFLPTGTSRCSHGRLTVPVRYVQSCGHRTSIVRAPCEHHKVPYGARSRSTSSLVYHHVETIETKIPLIDAQRVRLANLRLQLLQVQRRRDFLVAAILLEDQRQHQQQRRRTMWVKPWLLRRVTLGHYDTLMQELMRESRRDFKSFLRTEPEMFRDMVDHVAPHIEKSQEGRPPRWQGLNLAITLRFLSTGNSYHSLAFNFRVARNTISSCC